MTPPRVPDATIDALFGFLDKATPGPHQTRFIFRMIRAVRNNQTTLGLMLQPDDTKDWADAELWAESSNHLRSILLEVRERRQQEKTAIRAESRHSSVTTHIYKPHKKYPWFCGDCGYAEHETLKHHPAESLNPHAQKEGKD